MPNSVYRDSIERAYSISSGLYIKMTSMPRIHLIVARALAPGAKRQRLWQPPTTPSPQATFGHMDLNSSH